MLCSRYVSLITSDGGLFDNIIMFKEFARREPDIAWVHTHPGWVYTRGMSSEKPFFKILLWILHPLLLIIITRQQDCAELMTFALLDATKGFRRYNRNGDDIGMYKMPKAKDAGKLLWEHSVEATGVKA